MRTATFLALRQHLQRVDSESVAGGVDYNEELVTSAHSNIEQLIKEKKGATCIVNREVVAERTIAYAHHVAKTVVWSPSIEGTPWSCASYIANPQESDAAKADELAKCVFYLIARLIKCTPDNVLLRYLTEEDQDRFLKLDGTMQTWEIGIEMLESLLCQRRFPVNSPVVVILGAVDEFTENEVTKEKFNRMRDVLGTACSPQSNLKHFLVIYTYTIRTEPEDLLPAFTKPIHKTGISCISMLN